MIKFPNVDQKHYPLLGGLDLLTPAISLPPGRVVDAQNYEPEISGGYRRIDGFERFDGQASPSAASYWLLGANRTGAVALGDTLTGATSGATGRVLGIFGGNLVLGRVTGTFVQGESLTNAGPTVGTSTSTALLNGATTPSDHADYTLLAANDQRTLIGQVPGSGRIRGVWVYKDVVYAFRDNAGGTAGLMYKATASGWQLVNFGTEIQFSASTAQINAGDAITGSVSGATATVVAALLRSGLWGTAGAGTLILSGVTGTFSIGEAIKVGGVSKATAATASTAITRQPGGSMEFANINFTGSTSTQKMYGVDGVNFAFEFDGTNYIPIRTGMATDSPSHLVGHKNYLFLSFLGSVQISAIGAPYTWSPVFGANEIAVGDPVTGFMPAAGSATGDSALAIFTKGRAHMLYGASSASFKLVTSKWDMGYAAFTAQTVSNDIYGLTARGIQALTTTLDYGDFDYASVSHLIQPLMSAKKGLETASTNLHAKNQYRLYFSDGTGVVVGLTGQKVSGLMPLNYGKVVRCMCTAELSTGQEVTYFGSDDGYVYQDNMGTSFDGQPIEAWCRLAFNNIGSPQQRKRIRRAVLEVVVTSYSQVNITYDLGYGSMYVQPSAVQADQQLVGGGGYWDKINWDSFTWDVQSVLNPSLSLDGTEKNVSLIFYSNRAQDQSHTLQGVTFIYSVRRTER